jgi:2-phosphosulfolactate phosphatase
MSIHIIEGIAGCHFAREHECTAIVVDALRASCTATMLFEAGAQSITLVPDVQTALAFKQTNPESLIFGERKGLPPKGFDFGNSPRTVSAAKDRHIAFTTSNGTALMLEAWGAPEVLMASVTNASATVQYINQHERDIVFIPAGNVEDPSFSAQEDWVAASVIAMRTGLEIGEGAIEYDQWSERIESESVDTLFDSAPHSANLRAVDLEADIAYCAQVNIGTAIPRATTLINSGLVLEQV